MKYIVIILVFFCCKSNAQTYKARSLSETLGPAMYFRQKHDANEKILFELKTYIQNLQSQVTSNEHKRILNQTYNYLTSLQKTALAHITTEFYEVQQVLQKIIIEHNTNLEDNYTENHSILYLYNKGLEDYEKKNYNSAIDSFNKVLEIDPTNTDMYFMRAYIKSEKGDLESSIEDYKKIILLHNNHPMTINTIAIVYNNIAYLLIKQENLSEAKSYIEKSLELDNKDYHSYDTRAEYNLLMGNYLDCIRDSNNALKLQENDNSYYLRALAQIKLGNLQQACEDLIKSKELGNKNAELMIKLNCK